MELKWIDPQSEKPKALERVLISYLGRYSKKPSISIAVYIPPNTDYVKENWFESSLESKYDTVLDGNIMHWCHLPLPPETFI